MRFTLFDRCSTWGFLGSCLVALVSGCGCVGLCLVYLLALFGFRVFVWFTWFGFVDLLFYLILFVFAL